MRPEAAAGTAMAANMYRVGGEYRAEAAGPRAGEVRAGSREVRPRRRGPECGPEPERGAGCGVDQAAGPEAPGGSPRLGQQQPGRVGAPPSGSGLGKGVPRELTSRQGRGGPGRSLCHLGALRWRRRCSPIAELGL